jgi:hypothetical protein
MRLEPALHLQFSPLKNVPGAQDGSPEHCRQDLLNLHARYLAAAGATLLPGAQVELAPLVWMRALQPFAAVTDGQELAH